MRRSLDSDDGRGDWGGRSGTACVRAVGIEVGNDVVEDDAAAAVDELRGGNIADAGDIETPS